MIKYWVLNRRHYSGKLPMLPRRKKPSRDNIPNINQTFSSAEKYGKLRSVVVVLLLSPTPTSLVWRCLTLKKRCCFLDNKIMYLTLIITVFAFQAFKQAAEDVKNLSQTPSNDELLEVYALFKQASVGDNDTSKIINLM